eukprot:TRINITY_DN16038_c0_g1_i1.p2 TRINITY_DN16038_c0_g1~~TRINITY_DN16038_c0_g1_i1.p2  ORF type:complete len:243 (+),score=74.50 TRINITY_DN16038_c0_g1_i1:81-731(+)
MGEEAARRWTAAELRELPLSTPRPVLRSAAAAAAAAAGLTPAQLGDVDPPLPDPGLPGCEVAEMDEVVPRVWLGSWRAAADGAVLRMCGITHVVCACDGDTLGLRWQAQPHTVRAWPELPGKRLLLPCRDLPEYPIKVHFAAAADFIDEALDGGGACLVHCRQGASRSAALLIAWMRRRYRIPVAAAEAFALTRRQDVDPNEGFREQLLEWDEEAG